MDWSPIETAPKDGTVVIVGAFERRNNFIDRAWWQPEFDAWITSCREMQMAEGYTINGKSSELHSPEKVQPTHWMPYKPPTSANQ